jgi:Poly (ADP-ribose) glycohydrolase (PARG)
MNEFLDSLIFRQKFDTQTLISSHPPKFHNANKQIVYDICCPPGCTHQGQLAFSRWSGMQIPEYLSSLEHQTDLSEYKGFFGYEPSQDSTEMEWYLNFAHHNLFCAYGSSLFAQDEMQVAEHPALSSLREALLDSKIKPLTVESQQPTPILIRGVERRCAISTDRNSEQGRPFGLYGNNFGRATSDAIAQATKPLNPQTITNIIAMEAPSYGEGSYSMTKIEYVLKTVFTGFSAARIESQLELNEAPNLIIHTGFWGCGAYGGNRVLMALLQLLSARLSQVNCLVFHTSDAIGSQDLATAQQILDRDLVTDDSPVKVSDLVEKIHAMEFQWGFSDGN